MDDCWLALYISIIKNVSVEASFNALYRNETKEKYKATQKKRILKMNIKNK